MQMTVADIRESYLRMSNKNKGVEILADRNGCKPRHIREILGVQSPWNRLSRADASGHYASGYGKYSKRFWEFYSSGDREMQMEYESSKEAWDAAKSVYKCMSRKRIYDVSVRRRRNVLYLERTEVGKC